MEPRWAYSVIEPLVESRGAPSILPASEMPMLPLTDTPYSETPTLPLSDTAYSDVRRGLPMISS